MLVRWLAGSVVLLALWGGVKTAVGLGYAWSAVSKVNAEADLLQNKSSLKSACKDMSSAWAWLDDPVLQSLELLPFFGADMQAVRTVTKGAALSCDPVTNLIESFDAENPLKTITALGPSQFRKLSFQVLDEIRDTHESLESINPEELHFGINQPIARAKAALARIAKIEPELRSMVSVGSALLTSEFGSRWFVATQNLAEARGTGGLLGSYAVVQVTGSDVEIIETGSDDTLARYGPVDFRSLPIDTAQSWGVQPSLWQDLNPSVHAPYTGKQIYDSWLGFKKQELSGVVFIGQGWAQNLVGLVGPIEVDGVELNSTNTAEFLAKGIYAKYPDVQYKNLFVTKMMKKLAKKVNSEKLDFLGLITAMEKNKTGDKIFAWANNEQTQKALINDSAAGHVDQKLGNRVWIGVNNGGGNKLEAYLNTSVKYDVKVLSGKGSESNLLVTLRNAAPKKNLPKYVRGRLDLAADVSYVPGSNLDIVSIYLPMGAELKGFYLNNESYSAQEFVDRGRQVISFRVYLAPGEAKKIWLEWKLSGTEARDSQPMVFTNATYKPVTIEQTLRK